MHSSLSVIRPGRELRSWRPTPRRCHAAARPEPSLLVMWARSVLLVSVVCLVGLAVLAAVLR